MRLNTLKPAVGAKKVRMCVGRGIGCGKGKTCGRGHKGQKARSGYSRKSGFEGGQMPLQRRVPKFGFRSPIAYKTAEVRLGDLMKIGETEIDIGVLKKANIVGIQVEYAKIILSGKLDKAVVVRGIAVTVGARKAIEQAGGRIEE